MQNIVINMCENFHRGHSFAKRQTLVDLLGKSDNNNINNKAIVDSRLRPQSCCYLAKCIEMQVIVYCKLDANNE